VLAMLFLYCIFIVVLEFKIRRLIVAPVADLTERIKNPREGRQILMQGN
jgi:hypothetical protein